MRVVLFGAYFENFQLNLLKKIILFLRQNGVAFCVEKDFYDFLEKKKYFESDSFDIFDWHIDQSDFAISFGGDGTFLATAQKIVTSKIPVLGINAGRLGFLADVSEDNVENALKEVLEGRFRIEKRSLIEAKVSSDSRYHLALNEIAILRPNTSSMISVEVKIDNEFVNLYKADGLLVSTPTGSTAYSLSAGGPIISPKSENFLIVPVAPHSLTARPLVIKDDCVINIKVFSRLHSYQVSIDGKFMTVSDLETIEIKKSELYINSIQPFSYSFFKTLRAKMMWGADVRKN